MYNKNAKRLLLVLFPLLAVLSVVLMLGQGGFFFWVALIQFLLVCLALVSVSFRRVIVKIDEGVLVLKYNSPCRRIALRDVESVFIDDEEFVVVHKGGRLAFPKTIFNDPFDAERILGEIRSSMNQVLRS